MKTRKARGSQKGVALLTTTIIVLIVAGMAAAFLLLSFSQSKVIGSSSESEVTLQIAEAGIEDAVNKLQAYATEWAKTKLTPTWTGTPWGGTPPDFAVIGNAATTEVGLDGNTYRYIEFNGAVNGGTYIVKIRNNGSGGFGKASEPVFGNPFTLSPFSYLDTVPANKARYIITCSAWKGKMNRTLQVITSASDTANTFKFGLFGDVYVDATGTFKTDGYDSAAGSYASQATNTGPGGAYAKATGNIGSNGNVGVGGAAVVMGNATPGPGGTFSGSGTVSGSTTPSTSVENLTAPAVTTTTALTTGWTGGDMSIGTVSGTPGVGTTAAGTNPNPPVLHWSDMDPSGSPSTLTIMQDVDIYVDGTINMQSNWNITIGTGTNNKPYTVRFYHNGTNTNSNVTFNGQSFIGGGTASAANFQVYSTTTGTIKFNGGSTVYAAVNAPNALFKNNGGNEFYGSMVAKRMELSGNAFFHYDENLAHLSEPKPHLAVVSWLELARPYWLELEYTH